MHTLTQIRHAWRRLAAPGLLAALCAAGLLACSVDSPIEPEVDAATIYQSLTLDQHGITLGPPTSVYDTLTVVATPRTATGVPVETPNAIQYTSNDSASVRVTSGGQIVALVAGRTVTVYARLAIDGVTRTDSTQVFVAASASAPAITSFSVQPAGTDSAKTAASTTKTISARFLNGATIVTGPKIHYRMSNYKVGSINEFTGLLTAVSPGTTTIVASATVYGKAWTDSVTFTVGLPITGFATMLAFKKLDGTFTYQFTPETVYLGVGGKVVWTYYTTGYGVTFDHPENVKANPAAAYGVSGNVDGNADLFFPAAVFDFANYQRTRMFPVAGTITYQSTTFPTSGRIVIVDDRACAPSCP